MKPIKCLAELKAATGWRVVQGLVLALWLGATSGTACAQVDEREMKAAYLFNFLQFTQWPVPPNEPFMLCVLGRTLMDEQLARLDGKVVLGERHVRVRYVLGPQESFVGCHALYVDDSQRRRVGEVLARLAGAPVLTITDGDGLADRGLMIEISKRDLKLGFEVNLREARRANLNFSARMLKMASYVGGVL